jgi:hypothetical protein
MMTKTIAKTKGKNKKVKKKASAENTAVKRSVKALKARHVACLCSEIESKRSANGHIPWGVIQKVVDDNKLIYTWLTVDILKKGLKKYTKSNSSNNITTITYISDLTNESVFTDANGEVNPVPAVVGISHESHSQNLESHSEKRGGGPKGSTIQAARDKAKRKEELLNDIATSWHQNCKNMMNKRNALETLIQEKKEEHGLLELVIEKGCIQQRVKRNRLICSNHSGTTSPMALIEEHIVALLSQMAKMRQPLNVSEGLSLANSLIKGTKWEEELISFKERRGWKHLTSDSQKKPLLGRKWYQGFWKRHGHLLERKKGQKFSKDRTEWSIYHNFAQMYDDVYDAMVEACVAKKLDEPIWVKNEDIETDEKDGFGRMATHALCHPDYVVFVDEVGCNTNQE